MEHVQLWETLTQLSLRVIVLGFHLFAMGRLYKHFLSSTLRGKDKPQLLWLNSIRLSERGCQCEREEDNMKPQLLLSKN